MMMMCITCHTLFQSPVSGEAPIVPSTVTVPEEWPIVPIVAVNRWELHPGTTNYWKYVIYFRHPVFPKFIKIVEINDTKLIEIIRRKVKLNQPYAGIFVKKSDENTDEVVRSLEEVYPVGTFAQIVELQDLGSRVSFLLSFHLFVEKLK